MIGKILIGIFIVAVLVVAFLGITNTDFTFKVDSQDDYPEVQVSVGEKYLGPIPLGYNLSRFRNTGETVENG